MKLHGTIELFVEGQEVLRAPRFWDRLKKRLGGEPDLRTGRIKASLEAAAIVDAARQAFGRLGATNAVSLVIDDQVLFQDRDARPDDLGDLLLAFHDNEAVFGSDFRLLRLAIEHAEAGLHMVIEIVARTEHAPDEPAARVVVGGRIAALEPRPGEGADAYRARVEPLAKDGMLVTVSKAAFDSFTHKVSEALARVMPTARVELRSSDALVQRAAEGRQRELPAPAPTDPRYDPMDHYYPNPMAGILSTLMWGSLLSMAFMPDVMFLSALGTPMAAADAASLDAGGGDAALADGAGDAGGFDAGDDGGGFGDFEEW